MNFRTIAIVLLTALCLTEAHSVFTYLFPIAAEKDVRNWFVKPVPFAIPLKWFIKFSTDYILWMAFLMVFVKVCQYVSYRLFLMGCAFIVYFSLDWIAFIYHYKIDYPFYYVLLVVICSCVLFIFLPMREDRGAKIKRLFEE